MILRTLVIALLSAVPIAAMAFDNGQYEGVDPNVRAWFKSVRSPHGVPCCDIADGHRVSYEIDPKIESGYRAFFEGEWREIPKDALVTNAGNPVGEAVVWYVVQGPDSIYVRCFVPGGGV